MKKINCLLFLFLIFNPIYSQEALKSVEEEYFDFLSVKGLIERPTLSYRTLSDSKWNITEYKDYIWNSKKLSETFVLFEKEENKKNTFFEDDVQNFKIKVFGPQWFNSYNTAAPFGQNDGALWQGKGYNTSFSTGLRIETYGLEATIKPQISFSQNSEFKIMNSKYGNGFGYFWGACDAPQRFGDKSFFTFDWNDSEIRYSWKSLTIGFGTQHIWLGPAQINSLLASNHASSYPKIDIGLRKSDIIIPFLNWNIGKMEARMWAGKLTESNYFDTDESNNYNQITGFNISYQPSFLEGLTIGFNKICICKWNNEYKFYYLNPFFKSNTLTSEDNQGEDQKASLTIDWQFKESQFDLYAEIGVDDFLANGLLFYEYARFPFHTITYTLGFKKTFSVSEQKKLHGLLQFEWNMTEASQDYQMWPGSNYNFGFHYQIKQGYTNKGQWLGSGIGYGGNSQYLSYTLYAPYGYSKLFVSRNNPDNNYIYSKSVDKTASDTTIYYTAFKANFFIGTENFFFINDTLSLLTNFTYNLIINPCYDTIKSSWSDYTYLNNFHFELGLNIKI